MLLLYSAAVYVLGVAYSVNPFAAHPAEQKPRFIANVPGVAS